MYKVKNVCYSSEKAGLLKIKGSAVAIVGYP